MIYTVSVRGFFGWTHYKVHAHQTESVGDTAWLVLNLTDGSVLTIPRAGHKQVRIGADHATEQARVRREKEELHQKAAELARQVAPPPPQMPRSMHTQAFMAPMPQIPNVQ